MSEFEIAILCCPLVFVLLALAFMPLLAGNFWRKNEGRLLFSLGFISAVLSLSILFKHAVDLLKHALIDDYLPFIIMLFTLYVLSNGIKINLKSCAGTIQNVMFLGFASIFSSIIGTTGASMLLLRPFLELNKGRKRKTHLIIFFIFLVSNIGGLLSPLGDPPLLLGYLRGVNFSWTAQNLLQYWLLYIFACLSILAFIDMKFLQKESGAPDKNEKFSIKIEGILNIFLIILTVVILFVDFLNIYLKNSILLIFCSVSFLYSKMKNHKSIDFAPFAEVARTFLVIFIVIAPALFILEENVQTIHKFISNYSFNESTIYFWMAAFASSFLDNAPSYLLFFNMAGGNATELMTTNAQILKAISVSSVVMGAMTYIGNAPNMMVRSIVEKNNIKMPSFIGYMGWSCLIILPISLIVSYIMCQF